MSKLKFKVGDIVRLTMRVHKYYKLPYRTGRVREIIRDHEGVKYVVWHGFEKHNNRIFHVKGIHAEIERSNRERYEFEKRERAFQQANEPRDIQSSDTDVSESTREGVS